MDDINKHILKLVQKDAKLSYAEIGEQVGLSFAAVNERLKKLRSEEIIKKTITLVNPKKVGTNICAFIMIFFDKPSNDLEFEKIILDFEEVQECHSITGEYTYLLKVRVPNPDDLEAFIRNKILPIKGVQKTNTIIALNNIKEDTYVVIPD